MRCKRVLAGDTKVLRMASEPRGSRAAVGISLWKPMRSWHGLPDFWPLFLRAAKPAELQVWAFDLLAVDGKDLWKSPLETRQ
jgi:hypothetical protein